MNGESLLSSPVGIICAAVLAMCSLTCLGCFVTFLIRDNGMEFQGHWGGFGSGGRGGRLSPGFSFFIATIVFASLLAALAISGGSKHSASSPLHLETQASTE
jgi:hypothetical protein